MTFQIKICTEGKQGEGERGSNWAHEELPGTVAISVGFAPITHYGLAPHAPLSSSLTPVQQFSILLLQFIYCLEQTYVLNRPILIVSQHSSHILSLEVTFLLPFQLFHCCPRPTILAYRDFSPFWTSIVLNSIPPPRRLYSFLAK